VKLVGAIGFELEPICGRESAVADGSPAGEIPNPLGGRGTLSAKLVGAIGFELEPICGRESAVADGSPQAKSRSRQAGEGPSV
jgi:hypothetical protein